MQITDTERLDFMLLKHRKVIVSLVGIGTRGRSFEVYVEEGFMASREYTPVLVHAPEGNFENVPNGDEIKRQAIDLAINESKEQTSEKSN